jgi:hypothetical protein
MQTFFSLIAAIILLPAKSNSVVSDTNTHQPKAGSVLFHSAGNKKIRVFNHHGYEVIDTAYFILYHGSKTIEKIPNKRQLTVVQYYFSKTLSDDIYELSTGNLEKAFPGNIRFHYAIEQQFRSDKDLMNYDYYLKEYKIKYLFSESLVK